MWIFSIFNSNTIILTVHTSYYSVKTNSVLLYTIEFGFVLLKMILQYFDLLNIDAELIDKFSFEYLWLLNLLNHITTNIFLQWICLFFCLSISFLVFLFSGFLFFCLSISFLVFTVFLFFCLLCFCQNILVCNFLCTFLFVSVLC